MWHRQMHGEEDHLLESAKSGGAFGEDAWNVPILRAPATRVPVLKEICTRAYDL
jgi:hypothetical protein